MSDQTQKREARSQLTRRQELIYFAIISLFWFSQYVHIPFQTPYLQGIGVSAGTIGVIVGAYGITQVILRLPVGVFADKAGRHKKIMMTGCLAVTISCLFHSLLPGAAGFFIANLFAGIASGMWISFFVFYIGKFPDSGQQSATSRVMIFFNGGMLLGFIVSSLTYSALGMSRMCFLGVLSGVTALILTGFLREPLPDRSPQTVPELLRVCTGKRLLLFSAIALLQQGIQMATTMSFTNQYLKGCGASNLLVGLSSVIYMLSAVFFSSLASRGACRKRGAKFWIPVIFCIVAAYCTAVPRITLIPLILLLQIFPGMSQGWLLTLATSEAMRDVPHEKKSTAMGFFNAVYAVGITVFPMFTGSVIAGSGMKAGYLLLACIALCGAAAVLLFYRFTDKKLTASPQ